MSGPPRRIPRPLHQPQESPVSPGIVSFIALSCVFILAACGAEAGPILVAETIDSAGVRVVVNPPPGPDGAPEWRVFAEPDMQVGVLDGAPEYQLFQVSGAVVLSDRTVVIGNRGSHDLRFYDADGRFLRSSGGEGDGPGEFRSLQLVGRFAGDSLLAFDLRQRAGSVFASDGTFQRSFRLEDDAGGFPSISGVLSSGDVMVLHQASFTAGEARTGLGRPFAEVVRRGPDGADPDSLGRFPGTESFVLSLPEESWMSVRALTFGRGLYAAAGGDRMAIGNNDAFSVRVYDAHGSILHVVRQLRDPAPTGAEDFSRFNDRVLASIDDQEVRRRFGQMFEQMPRPENFPAYASIRIDREGNLWVEDFRRPGEDQPIWQVFNREGALVAQVRTPAGLRVLDVGEDYILGVTRDNFDVEYVRLHRLQR